MDRRSWSSGCCFLLTRRGTVEIEEILGRLHPRWAARTATSFTDTSEVAIEACAVALISDPSAATYAVAGSAIVVGFLSRSSTGGTLASSDAIATFHVSSLRMADRLVVTGRACQTSEGGPNGWNNAGKRRVRKPVHESGALRHRRGGDHSLNCRLGCELDVANPAAYFSKSCETDGSAKSKEALMTSGPLLSVTRRS